MKILIVHNRYQQNGGEEAAVEAQIRLLKENGHQVIQYQRDNAEIKNYGLIKRLLFPVHTIFSIKTVRDITHIISREKPDIAHVHNVFPLISPTVYTALFKTGLPIIQTIHNFRFMCPNGLFFTHGKICELCKSGNTLHAVRLRCFHDSVILSAIYAISIGVHRILGTFNKISGFITLNAFTKQKIIESGLARDSDIRVISNHIPVIPQIEPRTPRSREAVYLGRLSSEKGVDQLIEAVLRIPDLCLNILGTGPMEQGLRISAEGAKERIFFHGFVSGKRKAELLHKGMFMVLPSLVYEQSPLTALEGMAYGLPLILPEMGGWASTMSIYENCLFYQQGDVEDLAEKIKFLLDHQEIVHRMADKGKRLLEEVFSPEQHYRQLIDYYRLLIRR